MAGDQQHIHDPAAAEKFARALGLQVGGAGHPFVGNWGTKGLYAYRSGQYNGIAYFGTGGSERDRLTMPHESDKYRPWNRYDPDIPAHIREKLIELEDDDSTSIGQPPQPARTQPSTKPSSRDMLRGENILVSEHSLPKYNGIYTIQNTEINGKPWFKNNSGCILYFYNANSGGGPSWSLDDRSQDGTNDWFRGGWIEPPNSGGPPLGTRSWAILETHRRFEIRMESVSIPDEDSRDVTPLKTGWYRIESADGSLIERVRVHRDEPNTIATNVFIATGDHTGDVMWYVEGNTVKVPEFGSTGTIQADGNITWGLDGGKAIYEGNASEPSIGNQSNRDDVGKIALKSVHGKYLSAQPDGRAEWNRDIASDWEFFELGERDGRKITLRSAHGKYVSAQPDGTVQINRDHAPLGGWEEFTVETRPGSNPGDAHDFVHLKSVHGKYLSAQPDGTAQWNRDYAPPGGWEDIQFVPYTTQNQGPAPTQNQEPTSTTREESIEILEAVPGKPVRFKINNRPSSNDAWVGIYPPSASNQEHGEENKRWKWLRNLDVRNASFPKQSEGDWSIRVFSDGGHTLHGRKDFAVKLNPDVSDKADAESTKNAAKIAFGIGLFLLIPGLPLLIIGSTSTSEDRLAILIPGAILMAVGGFALLMSIAAVIRMGSTSVVRAEAEGNTPTRIEVLSFNHNQPIRFRISNPPHGNNAWVGIYPVDTGDRDHDDRWRWLRDLEVNDATLPGQAKGQWSIRLFSDGGYTLHERTDFEILEGYKNEVWMRNARIEDSRIIGDMIDHPTFGNMNRRTSPIIKRTKHGNMHRFETNNTTYLIKDEDLRDEVDINDPFWK